MVKEIFRPISLLFKIRKFDQKYCEMNGLNHYYGISPFHLTKFLTQNSNWTNFSETLNNNMDHSTTECEGIISYFLKKKVIVQFLMNLKILNNNIDHSTTECEGSSFQSKVFLVLLVGWIVYLVIYRISVLVVWEDKLFSLQHQEVRTKFQPRHLRTTFAIADSYQPVVIASLKWK